MAKKKFFGTDGIRGQFGHYPITTEFAYQFGQSIALVFASQKSAPILIGRDTRTSGPTLEKAIVAGIISQGVDVIHLGIAPTPAIAFLTHALNAHAGIVISASHNHYLDNGIKVFNHKGNKLDDNDEHLIESYLIDYDETRFISPCLGKAHQNMISLNTYYEYCINLYHGLTLKFKKIVIDCAHGATFEIIPKLFKHLGANITLIGAHPNGKNINHKVGSTQPQQLINQVISSRADLGLAFDGDGDRLIMVDHMGELVEGDELLFLLALEYKETGRLKGGVVGTQMSNYGLELSLNEHAIPFVRAQVGDRYVIEQLEQRQWNLGGEGSGHIICKDRVNTGDAIIAALEILSILEKKNLPLHSLKRKMHKFDQVLLNVHTPNKELALNNEFVKAALIEGEKILSQEGRILLRASGTEPLTRVMVEGKNNNMIRKVAQTIAQAVEQSQIA